MFTSKPVLSRLDYYVLWIHSVTVNTKPWPREKFLIFMEQNPCKDILIPCKAITKKLRLNLHFLLGNEAITNACTACPIWLDKSKISFRWVVVRVKMVSTNTDCSVVFRFTRRIVDVIDQSPFSGKVV